MERNYDLVVSCHTHGCSEPVVYKTKCLCKRCYHKQRSSNESFHERRRRAWATRSKQRPEEHETVLQKKRTQAKVKYDSDLEFRSALQKKNRLWAGRRNGFSPELTKKMLSAQNDRCAICRILLTFDRTRSGIQRDHCHESGLPRGLLCRSCNLSIGIYEKHQRPVGLRIAPYELYIVDFDRAQEQATRARELLVLVR